MDLCIVIGLFVSPQVPILRGLIGIILHSTEGIPIAWFFWFWEVCQLNVKHKLPIIIPVAFFHGSVHHNWTFRFHSNNHFART